MVSIEDFRGYILNLENVSEELHHEIYSYKAKNKKIFATLNTQFDRACVKLNEIDQSSFCSYKSTVMYPVPNRWGKYGWTMINLNLIPEEMLQDAITTAYETILKRKK